MTTAASLAFQPVRGISGLAPTSEVAARLREATNNEFQSHLIPAREGLVWQQLPPPIQFAQTTLARAEVIAGAERPVARELAAMAADVYNDVSAPPAGYRVATEADLSQLGLRTQDLSSAQSAFRARVYVAEGEGTRYVVSFRGSTEGSDWRANAQQAVGLPSDQYARALLIGKALARNPDADVTLTGHSLGGGLASAAALASGRDAATFNAAGLSAATIRQADTVRSAAGIGRAMEISAFYVRGEILSAVQDGGDRVLGAIFGGVPGAIFADAPEAYGTRVPLDAIRPKGTPWYQDNPVARHGMDWVLSSMPGR